MAMMLSPPIVARAEQPRTGFRRLRAQSGREPGKSLPKSAIMAALCSCLLSVSAAAAPGTMSVPLVPTAGSAQAMRASTVPASTVPASTVPASPGSRALFQATARESDGPMLDLDWIEEMESVVDADVLRYAVGSTELDEGCNYDLDLADPIHWSDPAFGYLAATEVVFGDHDFLEASDTRCQGTPAYRIEMQSRIFYPVWTARAPKETFPLVLILHGQQTDWDVPGYQGYDYLAYILARAGYVVVSIDGRSLMDSTIKSRGELIREHLRRFAARNARGSGSFLEGRLDLSSVVLIGHSRGGDAITAAWEWQRVAPDPEYHISALVAIAPVQFFGVLDEEPSFQTHLRDVSYQIIQGSKDGDVYDFQGMRTYDRAGHPQDSGNTTKSMVYVRDANHNFFNKVWEDVAGDEFCCGDTLLGEDVRFIAATYVLAFLQYTLFQDPRGLSLLTGERGSPVEGTQVAVDLQLPESLRFPMDNFEALAGAAHDVTTNSLGLPVEVSPASALPYVRELDLNTAAAYPYNSYPGETGGLGMVWLDRLQYSSHLSKTLQTALASETDLQLSFRLAEVATNGMLTEEQPHMLSAGWLIVGDELGNYSIPIDIMPHFVSTTYWQGIKGGPKTVMSRVRLPLSNLLGIDATRVSDFYLQFEFDWQGQLVLDDLELSP